MEFAKQYPAPGEGLTDKKRHPITVPEVQFRKRIFNEEFQLTFRQEFWCWRMAYHKIGMRAVREVYLSEGNFGYQNTMSCKLKKHKTAMKYVARLCELNKAGKINLKRGPWTHFSKWIGKEFISTEIEGCGPLALN